MRLRAALDDGDVRLKNGPHPERARRDAELLLLFATGLTRAAMLAHMAGDLDSATAARYAVLIERRFAGEPIQYITGETEFYGLPFRVTRDVLIPRPETEHLVEKAIELATHFPVPRIVDIGTGSGAVAVALAHALPGTQITTIDISETALDLACQNAKRNNATVRFLHGDLLAPVAGERFEIVVSNPPYVPTTDRHSLAVEVRDYEPGLALFAGEDGLDVYRRLIPAAFSVVVPGGFIALEIGYGQSEAIRTLLSKSGFNDVAFTPDLQGIPRVVTASRS